MSNKENKVIRGNDDTQESKQKQSEPTISGPSLQNSLAAVVSEEDNSDTDKDENEE